MGVEIERKYLVNHNLWHQATKPEGLPYKQGYLLNTSGKTVRVRTAGPKGYITIKGATEGFTRKEYEYEIPVNEANELLTYFAESRVEKVRYRFPFAGKVWEVDEFGGDNAGLIVAELELHSEDETFEVPDWITNEITGEDRYYNAALSLHPFKRW